MSESIQVSRSMITNTVNSINVQQGAEDYFMIGNPGTGKVRIVPTSGERIAMDANFAMKVGEALIEAALQAGATQ